MLPASAVALAAPPGPAAKAMPVAKSDGPLARGDRLTGHYFCAQGRTDLTIAIEDVRGDEISAVFEFVYRGGRMPPAEGSFQMHGTLERDGALDLEAGEWIDQPDGYVTVGLSGKLSTQGSVQTYKGTVKSPPGGGCSTFLVTRRAVLPSR